MPKRNKLLQAPPFPVEHCLRDLGNRLRTARIRRNLTIADAAERIGTGARAVMDAEKGKPATGMVVYAALLWLYDQLEQLDEVGDPSRDTEGSALDATRARRRARRVQGLDNDF